MRTLHALWRVLRTVLHLLLGMGVCAFLLPFLKPPQRLHRVGAWCDRLLKVLGIAVHVTGTPHPGPVLLVANHVSWLDIVAINAVHTARFVSKADVRRWPLIGWLVACGGTLFIERERKRDAMRVVHHVADSLKAGDVIAVFPEGTTSDGHGLLPFHANLLQAAVATGTPVQPVALRYADAGSDISPAAAYIGDMTLVQSLWWITRAEGLRVQVALLPPQATAGRDRRIASEAARAAIANALGIDMDAPPAMH